MIQFSEERDVSVICVEGGGVRKFKSTKTVSVFETSIHTVLLDCVHFIMLFLSVIRFWEVCYLLISRIGKFVELYLPPDFEGKLKPVP